ncbi:MAG: hypothetical protein QXM35_07235 [Candidatus Methanomethylicia archaeon]
MRKESLIIIALIMISITQAQQIYTINEATLIVYKDGIVHVKMVMTVNETYPSITIPLLSKNAVNILAIDENKIPLAYSIDEQNITIYTLGAKTTILEYDTNDLTSKNAGLWTLAFNSPFEINVILPENSTIIYINTIPTQISTIDKKIIISMPAGYCEISYEIPITPPIDFTITLIQGTSLVIQGESVSTTINIAQTMGTPSQITLSAIGQPQGIEVSFNPSIGIPPFTSIMNIKVSQNVPPGTYTITILASGRGITKTATYTIIVREYRAPLITPIIIGIGVVIAIIAIYFIWKYPIKRVMGKGKLKELTEEEEEILKYIREKGGKVLEAELREKFPSIPRTTLWRMVRRLENKGIIKVRKVGLQNVIELT